MKRVTLFFITILLTFTFAGNNAYSAEDESGFGIAGELELVYQVSRNKSNQRSLFTKRLEIEKEIGNDFSLFGIAYHDQEFKAGVVGISKKIGNFTLALGAGTARYDGLSRATVNPWVYYEDGTYEALYSLEWYNKESDEAYWYRAYVQKRIGEFLVGIYGEKDSGFGPMAGMYLNKDSKIWVSVPVSKRPETGGAKAFIGLVYTF